jgi:hypothetical protein
MVPKSAMSDYEQLTAERAGRGLIMTVPNAAGYDFFLGGKDNFAADRDAADTLMKLIPDSTLACRQNRSCPKATSLTTRCHRWRRHGHA